MNIIVSTTTGWNCGDDYIRQGVLAIAGIDTDRCNLIYWDRRPDSGRTHGNDQRAMLEVADAVIIAGTPEWIGKTSELYLHAAKNKLPIAMIGVGMDGAPRGTFEDDAFADCAKLVKFAMARDSFALEKLEALGVSDAFIGPDPAFFAPYAGLSDKYFTVCWRHLWRGVDLNPPSWRFDFPIVWENDILRTMVETLAAKGILARVVVHDHREIVPAQKALGCRVEFFSDLNHTPYSNSYSISHRIHGLIPTLAMGGGGCLRYTSRKAQVIEKSINYLSANYDKAWGDAVAIQSIERRNIPDPDLDSVGLGVERAQETLSSCMFDLSERLFDTDFRRFMEPVK